MSLPLATSWKQGLLTSASGGVGHPVFDRTCRTMKDGFDHEDVTIPVDCFWSMAIRSKGSTAKTRRKEQPQRRRWSDSAGFEIPTDCTNDIGAIA